jgi:hypothetical protein
VSIDIPLSPLSFGKIFFSVPHERGREGYDGKLSR